jgi:hypothetical protein
VRLPGAAEPNRWRMGCDPYGDVTSPGEPPKVKRFFDMMVDSVARRLRRRCGGLWAAFRPGVVCVKMKPSREAPLRGGRSVMAHRAYQALG